MIRKNWNPAKDEPTVAPATPACYSVEAAAMRIGVGRAYIFTLIKEGALASMKLGRRRLTEVHTRIDA